MRKEKYTYSRKEIKQLCDRAAHQDEAISKPAVKRLFSGIVENLSDSFLPARIALYDRIFAQVIDHCRHLPDGQPLDSLLTAFGLSSEADLLARKKRVQTTRRFPATGRRKVRKICVLSRVTVGADVAVTSVVLTKIRQIFPGIQTVLIGPQKLTEIFGGNPDITVRDVPYARRGGLLGRLNAWCDLVRVIDEERQGLKPGEFLVIDPDSRLTQLGLLPVMSKDEGYYFFQSRTYAKARSGRIGELTGNWLDEVFGAGTQKTYPEIFIDRNILDLARTCARKLSSSGEKNVISINFGVGGNERKRVSPAFEKGLVEFLLKEGRAVILDKGFGAEVEMMNRLVAGLRSKGKAVLEADPKNISTLAKQKMWRCDVLTWEGGIDVFGALIAGSDAYIGYDSGFQHIACAQGVPVIDVFMGAPSGLFIKRWMPYGRSPAVTVGGCSDKDRRKKAAVTPKQVVAALKKVLPARA